MDNVWGTVSDDGFDINAGHVVCRQLGYRRASAVECCAAYGRGSGQIWLDKVSCTGLEDKLEFCTSPGWGNVDLRSTSHLEDVSVSCVEWPKPPPLPMAPVGRPPPPPPVPQPPPVQLTGRLLQPTAVQGNAFCHASCPQSLDESIP